MPRILTTGLDYAQIAEKRKPKWKVVVYDVRSGNFSIGDVVVGNPISSAEWRDFTDDTFVVAITEKAGNFIRQGITASSLSISILDPHGLFDPLDGDEYKWLRQKNVIRIWEGDDRIDPLEWPVTFTGELVGQAGVLRSRAVSAEGIAIITAKALSREAGLLGYKTTSSNFSEGTNYKAMATTLATDELGLDSAEIDFAGWGVHTTGHVSTQFVQEEALRSIAKIMFVDGFMPRFNGEGKLTQTSGVVTKAPRRVYDDGSMFQVIERSFSNLNGFNRVVVLGLAAEMTKILQAYQLLKSIEITTGYFASDEEIEVYWSEDHSVLVDDTELVTIVGINSGISLLGGDEDWNEIVSPQGEGTIGGILSVSTGFAPYVIVFLTAVYVVLALIPDDVLVIQGAGFTISIGRLLQAGALAVILLLMTKIGRGRYEVWGTPFEYVFLEIKAVAELDNLLIRDRNEVVIENHLIQNETNAENAAEIVLFREQARQNRRAVTMFFDLLLEPDDVFETSDGRRFMIDSVTRTLVRGEGSIWSKLDCYEVSSGVLP